MESFSKDYGPIRNPLCHCRPVCTQSSFKCYMSITKLILKSIWVLCMAFSEVPVSLSPGKFDFFIWVSRRGLFLQVGLLYPAESGSIQIAAGANASFHRELFKEQWIIGRGLQPSWRESYAEFATLTLQIVSEKCDKNQGKGTQPGRKRVLRMKLGNSIR